jgi:hypothetical protein
LQKDRQFQLEAEYSDIDLRTFLDGCGLGDAAVASLLFNMLRWDPVERASTVAINGHPFFNEGNLDAMMRISQEQTNNLFKERSKNDEEQV